MYAVRVSSPRLVFMLPPVLSVFLRWSGTALLFRSMCKRKRSERSSLVDASDYCQQFRTHSVCLSVCLHGHPWHLRGARHSCLPLVNYCPATTYMPFVSAAGRRTLLLTQGWHLNHGYVTERYLGIPRFLVKVKTKLSLYFIKHDVIEAYGKWRYSSTHS
jgi:hypothetical protein